MKKPTKVIAMVVFCLFVSSSIAVAQTTEFTYQGRLLDASLPANAIYDFEFRVFAVETGGVPLATVQRSGVTVSSGIFGVKLDFGATFDGAARWIEIAVKRAATSDPLVTLNPRQPITSTPYSIRSLHAELADTSGNSLQLGGVAANQYVLTTDSRMADARDPLPGSANYIQNSAVQQASSNFNVSGSGNVGGTFTANAVTSATQFNIGINRALAFGVSSVFAGRNAGNSTTTGSGNSFFGESAGRLSTSGSNNSFVGHDSGVNNAGGNNSFFGAFSGNTNTTGSDNSYFGFQSGNSNTTGQNNSFFGTAAGLSNTTGGNNSFFGFEAGLLTTIAGGNSFFGSRAGRKTTSLFNAFFGYNAGATNTTGDMNSFFGYSAGASNTASNNSFFGSLAGSSNTTGAANTFMGESAGEVSTTGSRNTFLGRWSGHLNSSGSDNVFVGFNSGLLNTTGTHNVFVGVFAGSFDNGDNLTLIGSNSGVPNGFNLQYATAIGADAKVSSSNTVQLGRANGFDTVYVPGLIRLDGLGPAGSTDVCRNASNIISTCSSSLRYKSDVQTFDRGLDVVRRLRPIAFRWNDGGVQDVGFGAEEVNEVEPLLTIVDEKGQIEGVKYRQITTVLVNAIKEQQLQIDALKALVCELKPSASVCREEEQK